MEELIGSVVSLIILVPIIYFLPLGLSNKGKGLVIVIAFIFANLGLLAADIFQIWQTALIILLLTILTVYILDKRFKERIFLNHASEKEDEFSFDDLDELESMDDIKSIATQPQAAFLEDNIPKEIEQDISEINAFNQEKFDIEEIPFKLHVEEKEATTDLYVNEDFESSLIADLKEMELEEISFLENRQELLEEDTINILNEDKIMAEGYMSDIEKLLEDDNMVEENNFESLLEIDNKNLFDFEDEVALTTNNIEASNEEKEYSLDQIFEEELKVSDDLVEPESYEADKVSETVNDDELEVISFADSLIQIETVEEELSQKVLAESEDSLDDEDDLVAIIEEIEEVDLEVAAALYEDEDQVEMLKSNEDTETSIEVVPPEHEKEAALQHIDSDINNESRTLEIEEETEIEGDTLDFILETEDSNDFNDTLQRSNAELEDPLLEDANNNVLESVEANEGIVQELEDSLLEDANNKVLEPVETNGSIAQELEDPLLEDTNNNVLGLVETNESIAQDLEDPLLEDANNNVLESVETNEGIAEELEVHFVDETNNDESDEEVFVKDEEKSTLQKQILHTMVSQLHLLRKQISNEEYEGLIQEHMHPNLPAQDYYTFASLLIEHYIRCQEIGKLQGLLTNLDGKFTNFPILDMEIRYLYEQYCENTR